MEHIYGRRRKHRVGRLFLLLTLLVITFIIIFGFWFVFQLIAVTGGSGEFVVEEGQGVNEISANLHEAELIKSKLVFETYLYLRGLEGSIKAGTYQLPAVNVVLLTKALTEGTPFTGVRATLIEGWTLAQMADELAEQELIDRERFMQLVSKPKAAGFSQEDFPIVYSKPDTVDLEGYLFPDTYFFDPGTSEEEIIGTLVTNLILKLDEQLVRDMDARDLSFHEVLTMASIIEKEVRTPEDRRLVSGLLWKRIDEGIPLQVDATVNYITGGSDPAVSLEATRIDNPFNTYQYRGLPPGPISNPGLDAIQAAVYPEDSPYYFYLSTPEGETIFSENLDQHAAAKNKYLR